VGWLEIRQNAQLISLPTAQLSSLTGLKPGELFKLPPAQLGFLGSPKGSLSCPAVQDPKLSGLLVSHPTTLLSKGNLSVSCLPHERLYFLISWKVVLTFDEVSVPSLV